jgi:hypothetical protein
MAAEPPAGTERAPSSNRRAWLLPVVVAVVVVLIGGTIVAAVLVRVPQPANAPVSAAVPTPSPSPAASEAAPSPSAAAAPAAAQDHQKYRNYVSAVIIDATGVLAATGGLAACRSDRTECVSKVSQAGQQVSAFQKDLSVMPAPACLSAADQLLRDGLTFQARGFQLAEQGVKVTNRVQVAQGLLLLAAGWWRAGQAVAEARKANC